MARTATAVPNIGPSWLTRRPHLDVVLGDLVGTADDVRPGVVDPPFERGHVLGGTRGSDVGLPVTDVADNRSDPSLEPIRELVQRFALQIHRHHVGRDVFEQLLDYRPSDAGRTSGDHRCADGIGVHRSTSPRFSFNGDRQERFE